MITTFKKTNLITKFVHFRHLLIKSHKKISEFCSWTMVKFGDRSIERLGMELRIEKFYYRLLVNYG
jgi:hypothetical protein